WNMNMNALTARNFDETLQPKSFTKFFHSQGACHDMLPPHARARIKIHYDLIGPFHIFYGSLPSVDFNHSILYETQKTLDSLDIRVLFAAAFFADPNGPRARQHILRKVLLKKALFLRSIWAS